MKKPVPFLLRLSLLVLVLPLSSCLKLIFKPRHEFAHYTPAPALDYADPASWAALPTRRDSADAVPRNSGLHDQQATAEADVFFIHPTTYIWPKRWNANPRKKHLNRFTDRSTIRTQASVFNAVARVYAPRYRQATLFAFFDTSDNGTKALELAYADVQKAFQYYLTHYNHGRPIIIASHSQGTAHATRLLHDFFENDTILRRQLVAAYMIGFKVKPDEYSNIPPCRDSLDVGCYLGYNTVAVDNEFAPFSAFLSVNPLTWTLDTLPAPASLNRGGVSLRFKRIDPQIVNAQVHKGLLWVKPPHRRGYPRFLLPGAPILRHSYHLADYALFYMNIRQNAGARVRVWKSQKR